MKKISILIPCYNEVENVDLMAMAVTNVMAEALPQYDYELLFIDNCSTDGTRDKLEKLCQDDKRIKAIFNVTNFGQFNSPFHGMCQTTGDCTISMCCDFQDPVELIPTFVHEWEQGHKIVSGIKSTSRENGFIYWMRSCYYKMIKNMSDVKMIEHFTGFGLYDRSFIAILKELNDPVPFLRGIVAEYGSGFNRKEIFYEQAKRRAGKTHNNFFSLYDAAMLSITSYTKVGLRVATLLGFLSSGISMIIALVYLIMKLCNWDNFQAGNAPMVLGVYILGSIQLFFIGLIGEYILNINTRVIHRPLVVEEKRLNFGDGAADSQDAARPEEAGRINMQAAEKADE
ncbi:MAG: glycosyltransferase family 2 protein [Clostridium sp.]|nr:glycosyltransferase family 2 protein [Clostridium sp.]